MKAYLKAAERGYAVAQCNLGLYVISMEKVLLKISKKQWNCTKAAEQKYATAQYHLGICYKNGKEVSKNSKKAVKNV